MDQLGRNIGVTAIVASFVIVFLLCCGGLATQDSAAGGVTLVALLLVATVGTAGVIALFIGNHVMAKAAVDKARAELQEEYDRDMQQWRGRKLAFDRGEVERCAPLTEWGAARTPPGTRRIDVVGGSLWGWEGFLTIFGSSMLRTDGALTVVDLTGQAVSRELVDIASRRRDE